MTYSVEITGNYLKRITNEWSKLAGEPVEIQATDTSEPITAFGSETACLRLFYKFKFSDKPTPAFVEAYVRYSENLKTWYFVLYPATDYQGYALKTA